MQSFNNKNITITNKYITHALNNINVYKPYIICLDVEFQSANLNTSDKYIIDSGTARFIREIGIIIFRKEGDFWIYESNSFVNFPDISKFGINKELIHLITSTFSTVDPTTFDKMEKLERIFKNKELLKIKNLDLGLNSDPDKINKILNNLIYEIDGKILKKYKLDKYYINYQKINKLYWKDKLVKNRTLNIKNIVLFLNYLKELSKDAVFLVKGKMDFKAINNTYTLFGFDKPNLENSYDIEVFNGLSKNIYGNSQLKTTFEGLAKTDIFNKYVYDFVLDLFQDFGDKAHNPLVDSLFTVLVGIIINIGLNKTFMYEEKYKKYKRKYQRIKKLLV